jgi:hypothetical protein
MTVIRAGSAADAAQIATVQREGWFAAYQGIIPAEIIDRVTAPDHGARVRQSFRTRPWQRMLVAVAPAREDAAREEPAREEPGTAPSRCGYCGTTGEPAGSTSGPDSRPTAPPTCSAVSAASPRSATAVPWIPSPARLYNQLFRY